MPIWLQVFIALAPLTLVVSIYLFKLERRLSEVQRGVLKNRQWNIRLLFKMFPEKRTHIEEFIQDEKNYNDDDLSITPIR